MAETLGSLCDKLTIVKLKQWHTEDKTRLGSLAIQEQQLAEEIDVYLSEAMTGCIGLDKLIFPANKVYKNVNLKENDTDITSFGKAFAALAHANCALWHEQEKVYEFEKIPVSEKDQVVKQLAVLNLQRNQYIHAIDNQFANLIKIKSGEPAEEL